MQQALKNNSWTIESLASYVATIIARESGNVLGANQHSMVISRLQKRLIDLNNLSPGQYYSYLEQNYQNEINHLLGLLTTHHTFFFREFNHFEYLLNSLDVIVKRVKQQGRNKVKILSAACSRGQEVYSLAMFFHFHLKNYPSIDFEIVGTDLDTESVNFAKNGVYPFNEIKSIPMNYLQGNWQKGTGEIAHFVKVKSHLKQRCRFETMNLLHMDKVLKNDKFDIIFCRNVFIYFDQKTIETVVESFKKHLYPNSLFITGLSESLKNLSVYKQTFAPSVYCFDKPESNPTEILISNSGSLTSQSKIPKPIRLLLVDDSPSVIKLLTKIFQDDHDFKVVGTASHGVEAHHFLQQHTVDAMTLDIHMPELDGVEYLKKYHTSQHPHVLMISSASREDTQYAQEALKSGAKDFVEKPALNNLNQRADEIKSKLKSFFLNDPKNYSPPKEIVGHNFEIKNVESKARIIAMNLAEKDKVIWSVKQLKNNQPPTFIFIEGNRNVLEFIYDQLKLELPNINLLNTVVAPRANQIYLCDFDSHAQYIWEYIEKRKTSSNIYGTISKSFSDLLKRARNHQVLLDENLKDFKDLASLANDIFPWTSFPHLSTEFLAKDENVD
jgi:chemotaxis protein methyltransferase CheR